MFAGDRSSANGVETSVVRLGDERIDRAHVAHFGLPEHPLDHRVGSLPDTKGAREEDRRLELSELVELRCAQQLAEAIADVQRSGNTVTIGIAFVREDCGDSGSHGISLHDRDLADPHPGDVGDGVESPGAKHAGRNAKLARARSLLRISAARAKPKQTYDEKPSH